MFPLQGLLGACSSQPYEFRRSEWILLMNSVLLSALFLGKGLAVLILPATN